MRFTIFILILSFLTTQANAAARPASLPTIPTAGIQGSVGAGFTNFTIVNPKSNFALNRGTYVAAEIERGFDVMNLYFTMTLSQMNAQGVANYSFTNLSANTTYSASNVDFNASLLDLSLGFKLKLIDGYWFRPYVEGGGTGSYYQINYTSKLDTLALQGPDYKKNDTIMGSGYYGEGGIEVQFTPLFGAKFAARFSDQQSKELSTQANEKLHYRAETYYFSALIGL